MSKNGLAIHTTTGLCVQTGQLKKSYQCTLCPRVLFTLNGYNNHQNMHRPDDDEVDDEQTNRDPRCVNLCYIIVVKQKEERRRRKKRVIERFCHMATGQTYRCVE